MLTVFTPPRVFLSLVVLFLLPFAPPVLADEAWPWTLHILGNADSRGELRPCT